MKLIANLKAAYRAIKWGSSPPRDPVIASWFGVEDNDTGVYVTADSSLQVAAVWSAVRLLSESIASLPLMIYKRNKNNGKERDVNHGLYEILHSRPNRYQTAYEFKEMMQAHVLLRGNAYGKIISTGGKGVDEVVPLHPDRVRPFWAPDGTRAYEYTPTDGPTEILLHDEMLHIMGLSFDGLRGMNPIEHHRRSLGLSIAAEKYGARFFKNDARPGVILEHPGKLSDTARQQLKESWANLHQGVDRAHKTAVLEEGLKAHELGVNPEDAQFLETRKFQVADIARIFRVPPHMIGDLDRATFSNIEQMSLEYVIYNLRPWLVKWEQAIMRDLFSESDRKTHMAEFLVDALLRGDITARYEAYTKGRQWGWLSANDVRGLENMNPIPGGDSYLVPLNMIPAQDSRSLTPEEVVLEVMKRIENGGNS